MVGMSEVGRLVAISFVAGVAGSAGGTIGKQDKSIPGGNDIRNLRVSQSGKRRFVIPQRLIRRLADSWWACGRGL
jgi:hypothetical protein